ncbi:glycosyl hydrolase [bacterium]|nr:glycosyl hydrolase [bacterium]
MKINQAIQASDLEKKLTQVFEASGKKIWRIEKEWDNALGTPVFTVQGKYTTRGWTEWTQGFQYGSAILQYDATEEATFLNSGRSNTLSNMAVHVTHIGVHDHGFNNISTYGNLWRLMNEGRIEENEWERHFYEMALKSSGAIQASRWRDTENGFGYICSFNGPHSLFVDTIRSLRSLAVSHKLGHVLMGEHDERISLLERLIKHARNTARFNVYYGTGRDAYDIRGRTVHEAIFNTNDGKFRCPSTQQGYSPFSTWTRGLAWAITGFAEELEYLDTREESELEPFGGKDALMDEFLEAALATSDFYLENTPTDGIPYWDTGAPGLVHLGDYNKKKSDPYNSHEPIDSSAAAIAAQGLIRLGRYLDAKQKDGSTYYQAGLTLADALFDEPYLSTDENHHGLILHSIYHKPHGWDYIPAGQSIPCGESSMWGDYHARELAVILWRIAKGKPYPVFFQ